jgi:hypothetical protein
VKFDPHLGIKLSALPCLQDSLQTTLTSPIRLSTGLVRVEEGTPKGRNGVDAATVVCRQEQASSIKSPRWHERADAKCPATTHHKGAW